METPQQGLLLGLGISTEHDHICWAEVEVLCGHCVGVKLLQITQPQRQGRSTLKFLCPCITDISHTRKQTHPFIGL